MSVILPEISLLNAAREFAAVGANSNLAIDEDALLMAGQRIVDAALRGELAILAYKRDGQRDDRSLVSSTVQQRIPAGELEHLIFTEDFGLVPKGLKDDPGYEGDPKMVPPAVRRHGWTNPSLETTGFRRWTIRQYKRPPTSKDRAAALTRLVEALNEGWEPTKELARECLDHEGFVVSGDQHENVWTKAWEIAGRAPPLGKPTKERLKEMRDPKYRWTLLA